MKFKGEIPTEMQNLIIEYCEMLEINHNRLTIKHKKRDNSFNGQYGYGKFFNRQILLCERVFNVWAEEENRRMSEFLIAHELVHAKFNERGFLAALSILSPVLSLKRALSELRANVGACQLTNTSETDLKKYFNPEEEKEKYNYYPKIFKTYSALTGGYIDGKRNYDFIVANDNWNEETASKAREMIRGYSILFKWIPLSWYKKIEKEYSKALI